MSFGNRVRQAATPLGRSLAARAGNFPSRQLSAVTASHAKPHAAPVFFDISSTRITGGVPTGTWEERAPRAAPPIVRPPWDCLKGETKSNGWHRAGAGGQDMMPSICGNTAIAAANLLHSGAAPKFESDPWHFPPASTSAAGIPAPTTACGQPTKAGVLGRRFIVAFSGCKAVDAEAWMCDHRAIQTMKQVRAEQCGYHNALQSCINLHDQTLLMPSLHDLLSLGFLLFCHTLQSRSGACYIRLFSAI